jgi:hypothetical protein
VNDVLEIGFWRQRHVRVERALALADRLVTHSGATPTLERELAAALAEIRSYDAESWPWRTVGGRRDALAAESR